MLVRRESPPNIVDDVGTHVAAHVVDLLPENAWLTRALFPETFLHGDTVFNFPHKATLDKAVTQFVKFTYHAWLTRALFPVTFLYGAMVFNFPHEATLD